MSIPLPTVNLANVSVNQSGVVSFGNVGISAGGVSANPANIPDAGRILIFNESGSGLLIQFNTSQSGFYLPAGAWQPIPIKAGETGYTWTVIYNLPNPPVTLLLTTYYYPGESIPSQPTLGNSPIGIGGTVPVTSVNTLSNEGNTTTTLIIDIGQVGNTLLITINSDGSALWSVLQGGVAHKIFTINNTGTPLTLIQSNDVMHIAGTLDVDQNINGQLIQAFSNFLMQNSVALQWKDTGGTARNAIELDNVNNLGIFAASSSTLGRIYFADKTGAQICFMDTNGLTMSEGSINSATLVSAIVGFLTGSISRVSVFSGTGTGTYNHGLGATPDFIALTTHVNGSQTMGYDSENGTTVHVTCGSGLAFLGLAIKG